MAAMDHPLPESHSPQRLRRELGLWGASLMGLGSIIGTGVFVSIGLAAGLAGPAFLLALVLAAIVAAGNGLSSAELAAAQPVSGGTYEYGYRLLHPSLGFLAGWTFLCAKSASAATAALGFGGYALKLVPSGAGEWQTAIALLSVLAMALAILSGLRASSVVNAILVTISVGSLVSLIGVGIASGGAGGHEPLWSPWVLPDSASLPGILQATAIMFVAYTGYGRIATLGEEVRDPRRTIPRAIVLTLLLAALLYLGVGYVALRAVGHDVLARVTREQGAPLENVARALSAPRIAMGVTIGATAAMGGVLLNLLLGLSRVVLAMARRGDMPSRLARLDQSGTSPASAVIACSVVVGALVAIGDVRTTWSFSAFSVLVYYAITNLAALRLDRTERMFHPVVPMTGLVSCLFLTWWIETRVWLYGCGLLVVGLLWWKLARFLEHRPIPHERRS